MEKRSIFKTNLLYIIKVEHVELVKLSYLSYLFTCNCILIFWLHLVTPAPPFKNHYSTSFLKTPLKLAIKVEHVERGYTLSNKINTCKQL